MRKWEYVPKNFESRSIAVDVKRLTAELAMAKMYLKRAREGTLFRTCLKCGGSLPVNAHGKRMFCTASCRVVFTRRRLKQEKRK